jgi:hypothetical protein
MFSVVTAVPSGPIENWCLKTPGRIYGPEWTDHCYGSKLDANFETICCDGEIIGAKRPIVNDTSLDLTDLICCRLQGLQANGFSNALSDLETATKCPIGTPVPLASLAATNTWNMHDYAITYTSASLGPQSTGNYIETLTPRCLWAQTASGVPLSTITVQATQMRVSLPTARSSAAHSVSNGLKITVLTLGLLVAVSTLTF